MNIVISILAGVGAACILVALTGIIWLYHITRHSKPVQYQPKAEREAEKIILSLLKAR